MFYFLDLFYLYTRQLRQNPQSATLLAMEEPGPAEELKGACQNTPFLSDPQAPPPCYKHHPLPLTAPL